MEIILGKYGEIALKGLNKNTFEAPLLKTIRRRIAGFGKFRVYTAQSTVYIEPLDDQADVDGAFDQISRVFGFSAISKAVVCEKDFDTICRTAEEYLGAQLEKTGTFKVRTKRADKKFPMTSMEISRDLGAYLLGKHPNLKVDVLEPEFTVECEIRDQVACIHSKQIPGAGGIPTSTGGRVACMLSGGIDSPVAAWMLARRGCEVIGVHFMSPPYTGQPALYKVERLAGKLSRWTGRLPLYEVPFTDCQLAIRDNAPADYFTVLMRRSMMRIALKIAKKEECGAIVTGESLGQVASQTLSAIQCTDAVSDMPVFRPLIGSDKVEISERAAKIDTFDISIEPYEDCCTIFTPKHPKTKPTLEEIENAEKGIPGLAELEEKAFRENKIKVMHFEDEIV